MLEYIFLILRQIKSHIDNFLEVYSRKSFTISMYETKIIVLVGGCILAKFIIAIEHVQK